MVGSDLARKISQSAAVQSVTNRESKRREKLINSSVGDSEVALERLLTILHCHEVLANLLSASAGESPEFSRDYEMPLRSERRYHDYKLYRDAFREVVREQQDPKRKLGNQIRRLKPLPHTFCATALNSIPESRARKESIRDALVKFSRIVARYCSRWPSENSWPCIAWICL